MNDKIWLICSQCGYNIEVLENEVYDKGECMVCGGRMALDLNQGRKLIEEPTGDNFPIEHLNAEEQEIISSIRIIGDYSTWEMIERINDAKLRLKYRTIFLKLGGKIPERED